MRKSLFLLPLVFILLSCQNQQIQLSDQITQINVVKLSDVSPSPEQYMSDGKVVNEITSTNRIEQIRKALEKAEIESTNNADLDLPTYKVHFLQEKKVILTLGYYPKDRNHDTDAFLFLEEERVYRLANSLDLVHQLK